MAKYYCAWKDNRGKEHSSEKSAIEADRQYEIEDREKARAEKIKYGLRCNLDVNKLPYLRYGDPYYNFRDHYRLQEQQNMDALIDWIVKNEKVIRGVLNG